MASGANLADVQYQLERGCPARLQLHPRDPHGTPRHRVGGRQPVQRGRIARIAAERRLRGSQGHYQVHQLLCRSRSRTPRSGHPLRVPPAAVNAGDRPREDIHRAVRRYGPNERSDFSKADSAGLSVPSRWARASPTWPWMTPTAPCVSCGHEGTRVSRMSPPSNPYGSSPIFTKGLVGRTTESPN